MACCQLFGVGEIGLRHELPQQPGFDAFDADGFFEMAGHGLRAARPGQPLHQPFMRPAGRQVQVDDGLAAGCDLVPQQRRTGIDETALHAGFGDDEFALLVKSMPL